MSISIIEPQVPSPFFKLYLPTTMGCDCGHYLNMLLMDPVVAFLNSNEKKQNEKGELLDGGGGVKNCSMICHHYFHPLA